MPDERDLKQQREDERRFFKRLKRLFSSGVVVRNVGGAKLKVSDTDHLQAYTSRTLYDRYSRIHKSHQGYSPADSLAYQGARLQLFRDYDIMDSDAIINTALDIFADDSTVKNESGEVLSIESNDENIREVLHNLFYDILNIEFNLWSWVRGLCKYGDFFLFLEVTEKFGIINVLPLSVYDTIRVEGEDPRNPYEVYFKTLGTSAYMQKNRFENFEIAHFRMLSDANWLPYGRSMVEGARRTWKQLNLMEDAMLVHRLVRAPDRRVFKVDIGNINPKDIDAFMERMVSKVKKTPLVDPLTGDYNLKFNLQNIIEDFYIPVRGGDSGTKIENLQGLAFSAVEDVTYLRNKMIGALKVPRAFLGYEETIGAKATLASEDVRFARTTERIQRIVQSELTKIAIVHLYAQGYTDENLVNFNLTLTMPSTVYQQEKISLWTEKVKLAQEMQTTNLISSDWIYENILGLSEDEMEDQRIGVIIDKKRQFRLASIETGQDPANQDGTQGKPEERDKPGQPPKQPDANRPKAGRPSEPHKFKTDRHPLGRDPHGDKENKRVLKPDAARSPNAKKLSREALDLQHFVKSLKAKFPVTNSAVLSEGTNEPNYLDQEPPELDQSAT